VARAKLEMVAASAPETPVIVNADDPVLLRETRQLRADPVTFAIDADATYRPSSIETTEVGRQRVQIENHVFELALFGRHQVYNLLAAYAAFRTLGLDFGDVDTAGLTFTTAPMRGQTLEHHGVTFFADCYNANPDSVRSGLASFGATPVAGRRVVILGDMLELGDASPGFHREAGRQAAAIGPDLLILVGAQSVSAATAARESGLPDSTVRHYDSAEECADDLLAALQPGDTVYIKGSRGIALEKIISHWEQKGGKR
jgi:UDP-N-acetylmuramyl pentapeptide synthase